MQDPRRDIYGDLNFNNAKPVIYINSSVANALLVTNAYMARRRAEGGNPATIYNEMLRNYPQENAIIDEWRTANPGKSLAPQWNHIVEDNALAGLIVP
jgi:hypothetical protein